MPKIAFSDAGLRSIQPPAQGSADYWDAKFPSFGLRVSQGGAKTFVLNIHKTRRALGRYPVLTLADARTEARRQLAERTLGKQRPDAISFQTARDEFLAEKAKARKVSTVEDLKDRLKRHYPFTGRIADITHSEIARRLSRIRSNREHNHALRVGRTFFNWAQNRRYITHDPMSGFENRSTHSRVRVLSDDELKRVWKAAGQMGTFGVIVRLLMTTGQRRGEIAALHTDFFDERENTICLPAILTKNHRQHTFPVGTLALALLTETRPNSPGLFMPSSKNGKPLNGWSKSKKALDKISGVKDWTLHDLRRTFRTIHGRIGTAPYIAERLVNHVSAQSDMERVYDLHKYLPEMRAAMDAYEACILKIIAPHNVTL